MFEDILNKLKPINDSYNKKVIRIIDKNGFCTGSYLTEEEEFLKSLRGCCNNWNDVLKIYNMKFPNAKRTIKKLKYCVNKINEKENSKYSQTGEGFTKSRKYTPEVWNFFNKEASNMTVQEIRDYLATKFNIDLPRDTVHVLLNAYSIPYKHVLERVENLDEGIIFIYNKMKKENKLSERHYIKDMIPVCSEYFGRKITKNHIRNVLYRNGYKRCRSFYIAKKFKHIDK